MLADIPMPSLSTSTEMNLAAVAALMVTIGESDFAEQLVSILRAVADFDGSAAYLVKGRHAREGAIKLWTHGKRTEEVFGNAYVAICRRDLGPGLVSRCDLRNLVSSSSERAALRSLSALCDDFVSYAVDVDAAAQMIVSVWRRRGSGHFSTDSIGCFRALEPIVRASAAKHVRILVADGVLPVDTKIERRLVAVQFESLTKRERQIVNMVFEGHCSESIGHALSISYGTVKIHKKNIYRKLQISSESELLRMFIGDLNRVPSSRDEEQFEIHPRQGGAIVAVASANSITQAV